MGKTVASQRSAPVTLALLPTILGGLMMLGWVAHIRAFVHSADGTAPMQFNTALGLAIAGLSLMLLGDRPAAASWVGALLATLGAATILEYISGVGLGLDQVFLKAWITAGTSHPGRMGMNTAFCFVVAGIGLAREGVFRRYSLPLATAAGILLISVSCAALVGYLSGIEAGYRWGLATRMAPSTALAFLSLGASLLAIEWPDLRRGRRTWVSILFGCAVAFLTFWVWRSLLAERAKANTLSATSVAVNRAHLAAASLKQTASALLRFHRRWTSSRGGPNMHRDRQAYLDDFPEISAIGWLESSDRSSELYTREGDSAVRSKDTLAQHIRQVVEGKLPSSDLVSGFMPHGPDGQDLVVGIQSSVGTPVFVAVIDPRKVLKRSIVQRAWFTRVSAGTIPIADLSDHKVFAWHEEAHSDIAVLGRIWTFAVSPGEVQSGSGLPDAILLAGLIIACFTTVSVYLWQTSQTRQKEIQTLNAELEDRVMARTREYEEVNLTLEGAIDAERILAGRLRDRERQLFATFDAGKIGTWTHDLIANTIEREGRLNELFGLRNMEFPMQFSEHLSGIHPDDVTKGPRAEQAAIDGLNPEFDFEQRRIWPDGSLHWYAIRGRLIRDTDGRAVRTTGITADITARKEAELSLKRSEQQFRELADAMPQFVWTATPDGNLDYYNQRWYDYTGMTFEQARDWGWQPVLHPNDLQNCIDRWTRSFTTGALYEVEYRFKRASDGAYRWHLGRAVPVRNQHGEIVRWFGTCTDIEDQKRSEAEVRRLNAALQNTLQQQTSQLHDSEERFRNLVESVQDYSILMLDPEGRIVTWTIAAERLKGYASAEILGTHISCLYTPEDIERGRPQALLRIAATEGTAHDEGMRVRKDGSRFRASVSITAIYDESHNVRGFSKITQDITERTENLTRARKSEELFRAILESAPDAEIIASADGKIVFVNAQAERLFGFARHELIGNAVEILIPSSQREGHAKHREEYAASARVRQMGTGLELKGVRKNGEEFPVEVSLSPVKTEQGSLVAASIRDITARKLSERQLTIACERAEEASQAKSAFLGVMSHEIRTPMNAILGMADLLWESNLDTGQRQYVEVFRRAGSNLLTLINDLLDVSKIEAGHLELESVEFDLEELLDQAMELIAPKARAKSISLLCRLAPGTATDLIGDPTRLRQILINLLGNAVKFTSSGEVVLAVENTGNSGEIRFDVRDTGIGISADKLELIFQNFSQADSSTTRRFGGTGLGLGISRRLVEQMGGNLTVESVEGKGSTFHFMVQFQVSPERKKQPAGIEDLSGRRVLLIDDNDINRLIQREALASWGLASDEFSAPEAALEALRSGPDSLYSIALVDSRMPQMDGFETVLRLREMLPDLPVIMLTSEVQPGDAARQLQAGISGSAVKPVKRSDLLRLVCQALRRSPGHGDSVQPNRLPAAELEAAQKGSQHPYCGRLLRQPSACSGLSQVEPPSARIRRGWKGRRRTV